MKGEFHYIESDLTWNMMDLVEGLITRLEWYLGLWAKVDQLGT